ncbi:MAG: SGNH/GDSL hydrolase family protein [Lachnospiraceae bacterium]
MKRNKFVFIGELIVIALLVVVITKLVNSETATYAHSANEPVAIEESVAIEEPVAIEESVAIEEPEVEVVREVATEESATVDLLKMAVFGDSLFDGFREEDGIASQLDYFLNANVANLAVGGTSAALAGDSSDIETWNSRSFNGMVYVATNRIDGNVQLDGHVTKDYIKEVDFSNLDYVIIEYGLNDYFSKVKIYPQDLYDLNTYVGALRHGIHVLQEEFPNVKIIILSPTYCQFMEEGKVVEDSNTRNFGEGTLPEYVEAASKVAEEMGVYYLDMYHEFVDETSASNYLIDGIHLNEQGRVQYANKVAAYIKGL